ncbi:MAG: sugar ABC transporter permease [Candidatus Hydrogenedentota bacterium]|nr:MAG: sugar ABC transporter permease [Candidatus Hydrogenedentota bacterium]
MKRETLSAYSYLLPFLTVFGIFLAFPVVYSIWISLHKVTLTTNLYHVFSDMKFAGLANYKEIWNNVEFWWSLIVTILYMILTIPTGIFLSMILAVLLNQKIKWASFFQSAYFLPNILDMLVIGLIWKFMYSPDGLFDTFFMKIGIDFFHETGFLGNPWTALPAIAMAMVLKGAGFGMVLFLTALKNISPNIFEAADLDGLTWWQKFRYIQAPLLKPIVLFLAITGTMACLNAFTEFYIMTEGRPISTFLGETVGVTKITGYYLFEKFTQIKYGYAAAMSYFLFVFALIISYINYRWLREKG